MPEHKQQRQSPDRAVNYISKLPDELLLKILQHLGKISPDNIPEEELMLQRFPFRTADAPLDPHPGLRSYPFLSQVCKQWRAVLEKPESRTVLWDEVIVDFGHELITAVHTPIAWSDKRPSEEDFQHSFAHTRLDAERILSFMHLRRNSLRKITLMSSEGYYSEEGDFVNLVGKHDFSMISFGMMCGMFYNTLEELTIMRCSDFFTLDSHAFAAMSCLKALKVLRVEDLQCRIDTGNLGNKLSKLSQLTELSLTANSHSNGWLMGLEKFPPSWAGLSRLQKLTLRGHLQLTRVPPALAALPLRYLDLSYSRIIDFTTLALLTQLETLSMQGMLLGDKFGPTSDGNELVKLLPDLSAHTRLSALSLGENKLETVPKMLAKLKKLKFLDLSCNEDLKIPKPLSWLNHLTELELIDVRCIHIEPSITYWSEQKCITMGHLSAWHKALRRKSAGVKMMLDTDA